MTTSRRTSNRTAHPHAAEIGPRVLDGTYWHGQDGFTYVVTAITTSVHAGWSMRVKAVDGPHAGQYRNLDDPWNPDAGDLVVSTPGSQR